MVTAGQMSEYLREEDKEIFRGDISETFRMIVVGESSIPRIGD